MGSEWSLVPVADLAAPVEGAIAIGPFGSSMKASDYVADGVPVIRGTNLGHGRGFSGEFAFVSEETASKLSRSNVVPGDLVFPHRGSIGEVGIVPGGPPERWMLSTSLMKLTCDKSKAIPEFVFYFFRSSAGRQELLQFASTVGTPGIGQPLTSLKRCRVPLPPIDEQRRIAAVLGALDDKIELNRKMNRTLEAMAQALFKSWFIDFDGVPDSDLVESELGPIPKGWAMESLDSVADFLNGAACQKYPAIEGEESLPVIKIRELNQGVTAATERATAKIPRKWWVDNGDVLFSWSGSLVVKVWTGGRGALNQHLFKVTSARFPRWFFLLWTRLHLREFQRIAADKATTMGHIKRQHLTDARCLVPTEYAMARFDEVMRPLVDKQVACEQESQTLATLRDTLLPRLISGEVRVPEAETAVEAVL